MSDNVSQLHAQKHPGLGKRIAVFALLLVLVTGGVAAYVFRDRLNLDALQRYVRYLNVSEDSKTGRFVYDESNSNRYADLSGGLSVASATGLSLYDKDGVETASIQASMSAPVLKTGGEIAMAYDTGGNTLEAASQKNGSVLHISSQKPILDADIASDGSICYLSSESGYRSVLYVYNSQQALIYRWLSSSQYFMRCTVSSGAKYAAAAALGQEDGMFQSSIVLFRTDSEEILRTIPIGNALIYDLHFLSGNALCVLCEDALYFYDLDGQCLGSYAFEDAYLKDYTLDGSGFVTLVMNLYKAGNRYTVLTVGYDGTVLGTLPTSEQILDISASGRYLALLTSGSLAIYDQSRCTTGLQMASMHCAVSMPKLPRRAKSATEIMPVSFPFCVTGSLRSCARDISRAAFAASSPASMDKTPADMTSLTRICSAGFPAATQRSTTSRSVSTPQRRPFSP